MWLVRLVLGAALLIGTVGCGPGESTGGDPVCPDPKEGDVPEECGIWASVSLGKDDNPGTRAEPVASLSHAVELAAQGPHHVYACGELWTESLALPGNVS